MHPFGARMPGGRIRWLRRFAPYHRLLIWAPFRSRGKDGCISGGPSALFMVAGWLPKSFALGLYDAGRWPLADSVWGAAGPVVASLRSLLPATVLGSLQEPGTSCLALRMGLLPCRG